VGGAAEMKSAPELGRYGLSRSVSARFKEHVSGERYRMVARAGSHRRRDRGRVACWPGAASELADRTGLTGGLSRALAGRWREIPPGFVAMTTPCADTSSCPRNRRARLRRPVITCSGTSLARPANHDHLWHAFGMATSSRPLGATPAPHTTRSAASRAGAGQRLFRGPVAEAGPNQPDLSRRFRTPPASSGHVSFAHPP
jgi:hypothetical protein